MIKKIPIEPAYRKDNGGWNLSTDSLPIPEKFKVKERNLVYIPPGEFGGNHKHPRSEAFVGVGNDLSIVWRDKKGNRHEDKMMEGVNLYLIIVEPFTPHAVVNRDSSFAILIELADGVQRDVERSEVLR
jgi:hypothetical protein